MSDASTFCPSCGTKVEGTPTSQQSSPTPVNVPPKSQSQAVTPPSVNPLSASTPVSQETVTTSSTSSTPKAIPSSPSNTSAPSANALSDEQLRQIQLEQARAASLEMANKAKAASQEAAQDAAAAFKTFASSPTSGLSLAYENLGGTRALGAGIAFGLIFALSMIFGVQKILASLGGLFPFGGGMYGGMAPSSPGLIKLLIVGLVPFISIAAAIAAARLILSGTGCFEGDVFTAGASLLPFAAFIFLSSLLGSSNAEVIAILFTFAICYTILMIFTGCTRIAKIAEARATLAVPVILLASAWISKVILASML